MSRFYFYDNFGKSGLRFVFLLSMLNSENYLREMLKLKPSPLLKSVTPLPCEKQVVNYTALQHT